jgi:hypothetical protein
LVAAWSRAARELARTEEGERLRRDGARDREDNTRLVTHTGRSSNILVLHSPSRRLATIPLDGKGRTSVKELAEVGIR